MWNGVIDLFIWVAMCGVIVLIIVLLIANTALMIVFYKFIFILMYDENRNKDYKEYMKKRLKQLSVICIRYGLVIRPLMYVLFYGFRRRARINVYLYILNNGIKFDKLDRVEYVYSKKKDNWISDYGYLDNKHINRSKYLVSLFIWMWYDDMLIRYTFTKDLIRDIDTNTAFAKGERLVSEYSFFEELSKTAFSKHSNFEYLYQNQI